MQKSKKSKTVNKAEVQKLKQLKADLTQEIAKTDQQIAVLAAEKAVAPLATQGSQNQAAA